ncbi:MAG: hypothetical protein WC378_09295 [Opitutaceae bacterium]|jgi:hypothetical protein
MYYADVIRHFGAFGFFELPNLMAFTQEKKASVLQTLHRWGKRGWIIPVRRGFYAFPEDIARNPITPETAANQILKDSYVTGLWRLNQLGLIPEGVMEITNATLNNPAEYDTPLGRFTYQHLSPNGFFGYETVLGGPVPVRIATPEKALLDFFWWKNIGWTENEFARWRIQDPFGKIDHKRLHEFAKRWKQPRLICAARNLSRYLAA